MSNHGKPCVLEVEHHVVCRGTQSFPRMNSLPDSQPKSVPPKGTRHGPDCFAWINLLESRLRTVRWLRFDGMDAFAGQDATIIKTSNWQNNFKEATLAAILYYIYIAF